MAVGAIGAAGGLGSFLQAQGSGQAQSPASTQALSGRKIDGDGDYDNSTPAEDAAEGKGKLVNLKA